MSDRILVVGPAWVGDMVMAQSMFMHLRNLYPQATIDVLAPSWTRPLLERMPEVNEAIALPMKHGELNLAGRYKLACSLRIKKYAKAILLPNSFKSALIPWWAKIPQRTGFRGEFRYGVLNDIRLLDKKIYPRMVDRFIALGLPKGVNLPKATPEPHLVVNFQQQQFVLDKFSLDMSRPVLALSPGAEFGSSKQWLPEHFAAVARAKLVAGWQVWLMGSAGEVAVTTKINSLTKDGCINLAGETSLGEAIDLLSQVAWVITNDSGLMHITAALNRPQIAVYGSTSAAFTPPLSANAKILQLDLPCQPCFKRECPLKHHRCMGDLSPDQILSAMVDWA